MTVFEFLNYRYTYEEKIRDFKVPNNKMDGTLENMKWFYENGHQKNRFREGFSDVLDACEKVINS